MIFGSSQQKAPTNTQSPIFPAKGAGRFPNRMASKAESTLSRRYKNFVAVQGSAHEIGGIVVRILHHVHQVHDIYFS